MKTSILPFILLFLATLSHASFLQTREFMSEERVKVLIDYDVIESTHMSNKPSQSSFVHPLYFTVPLAPNLVEKTSKVEIVVFHLIKSKGGCGQGNYEESTSHSLNLQYSPRLQVFIGSFPDFLLQTIGY